MSLQIFDIYNFCYSTFATRFAKQSFQARILRFLDTELRNRFKFAKQKYSGQILPGKAFIELQSILIFCHAAKFLNKKFYLYLEM